MKNSFSRFAKFSLILLLNLAFVSSCNFKLNKEHPQVTKGRTLYNKYCLDCHGVNGKGEASMISEFSKVDLTKINYRRDLDEFPVMEIARYIDGREHYKDFGSRPMPMWGVDMMSQENQFDPDTARTNLGAIISYLITLQEN